MSKHNTPHFCIIFDIDETMIQFLHNQSTINKWHAYKQIFKNRIEAQETDAYILLFRPGLRDFIQHTRNHNIDIAIWTYGSESYSKMIEVAITKYAGLEQSPFTFVYSNKEIEVDLANNRGEKDLRRIYEAFPGKYTPANTFLVDNRAANIFHESNCENGIVVESFDITAGYSPNQDTMFQNIKHICGQVHHNTSMTASIFSKANIIRAGIKQFYNRYIVKGIPLSLISEGALDRDSNFYPAPNRTRNSNHKYKNKTRRRRIIRKKT
jgi:HAD superfamily phosphatase (TIGR01681 family)